IADTHIGKKIRCPKCQVAMLIEAPAAPVAPKPVPPPLKPPILKAEEEPLEEAPLEEEPLDDADVEHGRKPAKKKGGRNKGKRMGLTRLELTFHSASILCLLGGALCLFIVNIMTAVAQAGADISGPGVAAAGAVIIIALLLMILGFGSFFVTPLLGTIGSL